ncbi:Glycosyltransferase WbsX [Chitinophaga sp. CF118]|uniref:glycosyltransferase WbsX family protein n=1 Tax=Chitinophaga sp. CF118 TaxID=1884367 RepID=UPI0008E1B8FB|nr:glycoside hydrolase family 99-like domain-containing protein [Chitinophaga sp. CF118]SFF05789.1 Glycosyltransferase WbsX [Chitinophaga sp. CF118]
MNKRFLLCTVVLLYTTGFLFAQATKNIQTKRYDVAAFVWPSYHPDDWAKIFWPDGIGEWQTVISNKPKFPGHEQPRYPLWGYINEADPYVAEMEINAAADHGVNVFIFDWYWYDGMPFLEGQLNDGYLKARNNNRVKFYLMWANHDVNTTWDKRNSDDAFSRKNQSLIWRADIDRKEFERVAIRWIEKYFKQPSYYKIDDKPVLMIYDLVKLVQGLGGVEQTKDAFKWFREQTVKAGFKGLELQLSMRKETDKGLSAIPGDNIGTQKDVVEKLGFNSLTHYQFVHFTNVDRDYNVILNDVIKEWKTVSNSYAAKYYPHVSVGWDASPRTYGLQPGIVKNNTPKNFENALMEAKKFVDAHPNQAPLITINSWNEWTETSYLMPCTMFGYGYLEAVKNVFGKQ